MIAGPRQDPSPLSGDLFDPTPDATPLRPVAVPAPLPSNVRQIRFQRPAAEHQAGGPGPESPRRTKRWGAHTETLLAVLRASFERLGIRHDLADGYARTALLALADYAGGREFYLPRAVTLRAAIRDAQIRREFNGRNLAELATRYQLTTAHVRKILKARTRSKKTPVS